MTNAPPEAGRSGDELDGTSIPQPTPYATNGNGTAYGMRALAAEMAKLGRAVEGERNNTLNTVWIKLCQKINAGHLDRDHAYQRAFEVARSTGLGDAEIRKTMASAETGAVNHPRPVPPPTAPPPRDSRFTDPARPPTIGQLLTPGTDIALSTAAFLPDQFWNARPWLDHIRQAAHSRGRSAEAVLGAVLARVAADTSHIVKLPPLVGAPCGLSLIVALAGPPGTGKSSSKSIAVEMLPAEIIAEVCDDVPPGSGEGLLEVMFGMVDNPKKPGEQHRGIKYRNVFAYADEGETLAKQAKRNTTSTILPIMRSVFTDATLGQANATEDRRRRVPGGHYVFGIVLGLQPDKAADLFDDAGGGTPQRLLWAPTNTPTPAPGHRPDWPGKLPRPALGLVKPDVGTWRKHLVVAERVATEVLEADHHGQQHGSSNLDEHAYLLRLKIAAVLGLMDGGYELTDEHWSLAGEIMRVSNATRARLLASIAQQKVKVNVAKGHDADQVEAAQGGKAVQRVAADRLGKIPADGEWIARKLLRGSLTSKDRPYFDAAMEALETAGQVEIDNTKYQGQSGTRYRRAGKAAS